MTKLRQLSQIYDNELKSRPYPIYTFRPNTLQRAITSFTQQFPGTLLYAVKTNPEPHILTLLIKQGIHSFDVASLNEIQSIRHLSDTATLYFMHPVKSRHAIKAAYHQYGVRHFSLDSLDELKKIIEETNKATDLKLHVRLSIPNESAAYDLTKKFGATYDTAIILLRKISKMGYKVGISFHVGSQCMAPCAYQQAIAKAALIIQESQVIPQFFNVGGGFPSLYPNLTPPGLHHYFYTIRQAFNKIHEHEKMQLLCEPGRAIVAESGSLIVRVEARRENKLYINDGTYGGLFDAGVPGFIFPTRLLKKTPPPDSIQIPFSFYGPTCDSIDYMPGPFYLPDSIQEGDYLEIGQLGAYSKSLSSHFNGYQHDPETLWISDAPILSMYSKPPEKLAKKRSMAA